MCSWFDPYCRWVCDRVPEGTLAGFWVNQTWGEKIDRARTFGLYTIRCRVHRRDDLVAVENISSGKHTFRAKTLDAQRG